jgi:hypothetical protein
MLSVTSWFFTFFDTSSSSLLIGATDGRSFIFSHTKYLWFYFSYTLICTKFRNKGKGEYSNMQDIIININTSLSVMHLPCTQAFHGSNFRRQPGEYY